MRSNVSSGTFFPWSETKGTSNPQDTGNFATYWQDSATGLDYANNRYYSNAFGRFTTPDPSKSSQDPTNPQSWNRYAYVMNDPVNANDPTGLDVELTCDGGDGSDNSSDCGAGGVMLTTPEGPSGTADNGDPIFSGGTTQSGDDGDDGSDDSSVGSDSTADPDDGSSTGSVGCTAAFTAAGAAVGADVGWAVGGGAGIVFGGGIGTILDPFGGTVAGGWVGGDLGSTGGALAGGSAGSALGGLISNIFCSTGTGGPRKGKRRKTAKPDKPGKHARPDPLKPGRYQVKDPHTGKWHDKPPGWRPDR
jgi:RHS repeat-associated protein